MRALFAVLGFVAFYAVTIAAILGLAWLGFMFFGWFDEVRNAKALLVIALVGGGCLLGAAILAWSALPRIDKFEPPGPELTQTTHPELFAMIRDVAQATGQRMPKHVYAVLEVNAFVTEEVPQISEFAYELEVATLVRLQAQIYTAALSVALEHVGYGSRRSA